LLPLLLGGSVDDAEVQATAGDKFERVEDGVAVCCGLHVAGQMTLTARHGQHQRVVVESYGNGGLHRLAERPEAVGAHEHDVARLAPDLLRRRATKRIALLGQGAVVLTTALGVAEHAVGVADQGEPLGHLGVLRGDVGVVLTRQFVVGSLDLLGRGVAIQVQHVIVGGGALTARRHLALSILLFRHSVPLSKAGPQLRRGPVVCSDADRESSDQDEAGLTRAMRSSIMVITSRRL